jgi:histidine ammonia-lyase
MTFAFEAADKLRHVETLVREVIAAELLVCRQAWSLRNTPVAAGLSQRFDELAAIVPPIDRDRPFGDDLSRMINMLAAGAFQ